MTENFKGQSAKAVSAQNEIKLSKSTITDEQIEEKFEEIVGLETSIFEDRNDNNLTLDVFNGDTLYVYGEHYGWDGWECRVSCYNAQTFAENADKFTEFVEWWDNLED